VKQNKKGKIYFVIYIAGEKKLMFYIYAVIVKQKKKALLITTCDNVTAVDVNLYTIEVDPQRRHFGRSESYFALQSLI